MANSQKAQKSISSFFTKTAVQKTRSNDILTSSPANGHSKTNQDDVELPAPKRVRRSPPIEEAILDTTPRDLPLLAVSPKKQSSVSRTSKYLFSSSPQQENVSETSSREDVSLKAKLHERFVKKLGKPDSIADIKRRNRALLEDNDDEDGVDEEQTEESNPPLKGKKGVAAKKGASKLTPLETQVLGIKKRYMDTLLVVEVGYKFRFFGEDARSAAKELSIVCIPGKYRYDEHPSEAHLDRFASASIPVHRLHVHVKRLVAAGHKVGVVRQRETAALKAAGDNRNAPFVRRLTALYTKGTYLDDVEGLDDAATSPPPQAASTGFLLCLTETNAKGRGNDEKVHVGIVAVQPATGDIVYDDFEDGFMRAEIETRLLHIAPCELLIVGEPSKATEKLVQHLSGSKTNVFGDKVRVERLPEYEAMAAQAFSRVSSFYSSRAIDVRSDNGKAVLLLEKVLNLPEHVTICLSAMIKHLEDYDLNHVFELTKYFQPFSARSHMLLNGNTLTSLEIYQNQTDHTVKGSLFWTLDRTSTKFGQRLLRKWVGRPLLDKSRLEDRLGAVEELLDSEKATKVEQLKRLLSKLKIDLEKSLIRIFYGQCTRPELLRVLQSLQLVSTEFAHVSSAASAGFSSSLISSAILALPPVLSNVISFLDQINLEAAKSDDKYSFFREEYETNAISEHKLGIASVEQDLDAFRTTAAEKIGKKNPVEYATVAGIEYLIEVSNSSSLIKKVPASWIKVSGTKANSRFHAPEVVKLVRERDQHKEALAAACDEEFHHLLGDISRKYQLFRDCIQNLATLDCLLSLATIAQQPGYVKPTFIDDEVIEVEGARHPMVEQILLDAYVPNDVKLSQDSTRAMLITGPNMGGKSSYVRSVALICIMAQIGCYVPASSTKLGLLDAVFTRMGAFDNMLSGESTFMVELSETSDILKLATSRSLVILDELGRGTSTHDGVAIAQAVLDSMVRESKAFTLFITHYQTLATMADGFPNKELRNVHMRFAEHKGSDEVTFLYEVGEGTAHRSYGLNVARLANIPERVIQVAGKMSKDMEEQMKKKKVKALARILAEDWRGDKFGDRLEAIMDGIEQL
jgi:DNA mismatch repair protein MSH3